MFLHTISRLEPCLIQLLSIQRFVEGPTRSILDGAGGGSITQTLLMRGRQLPHLLHQLPVVFGVEYLRLVVLINTSLQIRNRFLLRLGMCHQTLVEVFQHLLHNQLHMSLADALQREIPLPRGFRLAEYEFMSRDWCRSSIGIDLCMEPLVADDKTAKDPERLVSETTGNLALAERERHEHAEPGKVGNRRRVALPWESTFNSSTSEFRS